MLPPAPLLSRDRLIGGLVGLLIGDALGVPVEFGARGERDRDPVRGMRGYGTHHQPVGAWSDDGALALAHAAAFVSHGWDPRRHLEAFLAWHEQGAWSAHGRVFDVGLTTRRALHRFGRGDPLDQVAGRALHDNGNGSLMRILPASCWWAGKPLTDLVEGLGAASALTHGHVRARLCCAWHGLVVSALLEMRPISEALVQASRLLEPLIPPEEREVFRPLLDGSFLYLPRERIRSDGYVVSTLTAAAWCLHQHTDFAAAVLAAVNLGDDTDTTAAVAGGLAGLRCGLTGIPRVWIGCLPHRTEVMNLAERFADACLARSR